MWKLNVSGATKQFLWRAATNSLPTKASLFKKRIGDNANCPICNLESETIMHALWQCPAMNDVWVEKGSAVQKWLDIGEE